MYGKDIYSYPIGISNDSSVLKINFKLTLPNSKEGSKVSCKNSTNFLNLVIMIYLVALLLILWLGISIT